VSVHSAIGVCPLCNRCLSTLQTVSVHSAIGEYYTRSFPKSGRIIPKKRALTAQHLGPSTYHYSLEKRKSGPTRIWTKLPRSFSRQPSHYTDWAILSWCNFFLKKLPASKRLLAAPISVQQPRFRHLTAPTQPINSSPRVRTVLESNHKKYTHKPDTILVQGCCVISTVPLHPVFWIRPITKDLTASAPNIVPFPFPKITHKINLPLQFAWLLSNQFSYMCVVQERAKAHWVLLCRITGVFLHIINRSRNISMPKFLPVEFINSVPTWTKQIGSPLRRPDVWIQSVITNDAR
jgi:hypothetical protein